MKLFDDSVSNIPIGERNRISKGQQNAPERSLTTADSRRTAQYVTAVAMLSKFEPECLYTEMRMMLSHMRLETITGEWMSSTATDDVVTRELHASLRRLGGVAVFSGIINLLTLSGSLYMLQVYDRVIPGRNLATLLGLSLIVLFAYLLQGYFDALRSRMLTRIGTLLDVGLQNHIHMALVTLPLRGAKPMLAQQPLRDLDQVRVFLSGMG